MQCAMAEGDGDSSEAGHEAMENLASGGDEKKYAKTENAEEKMGMSEDDEELDDEKKKFMKHGRKLPSGGKGTGMVMMKMITSKKPEMKKTKYG